MTEHTPTPWVAELVRDSDGYAEAFNIRGDGGKVVVGPEGIYPDPSEFAEADANAALIVRAVNIMGELERLATEYRPTMDADVLRSWSAEIISTIRGGD